MRGNKEPTGEIRFHTEMVERASRAVDEVVSRGGATGMEIAIAVLHAIREPTEAMMWAAAEKDMMLTTPKIVWQSMLDAALGKETEGFR